MYGIYAAFFLLFSARVFFSHHEEHETRDADIPFRMVVKNKISLIWEFNKSAKQIRFFDSLPKIHTLYLV